MNRWNQEISFIRQAAGLRLEIGSHAPSLNRILARLPAHIYQSLLPNLESISLRLGEEIFGAGEARRHLYFPTTAIISLLYTLEDGRSAEIGVVGNDGVLGISIFMGGESLPNRAVVQSAGVAFRMPASTLMSEFYRSGIFQRVLLRYTLSFIAQMSQTAVCYRLHSVEQQLCRWLLLRHDRLLPSNELIMTQELIADVLGVRREAVSQHAARLQDAGIISYHRGHIAILDRAGLEARGCECYGVIRREVERLTHMGLKPLLRKPRTKPHRLMCGPAQTGPLDPCRIIRRFNK
jgi:CRP-like cAMP-binding protein